MHIHNKLIGKKSMKNYSFNYEIDFSEFYLILG